MNPLIIKYEGCKRVCYYDTGFVPTIGYGHTRGLTDADVGVKRITKLEAYQLLESDMPEYENIIRKHFGLNNYNRFTALTSFVFNLGEGALFGKNTKIATHVKAGRWQEAAAGMLYYIKDNGVVLNGLVARRCEEASYLIKG